MGLFDWLRGNKSNVESLPDRIWMSDRARSAGIAQEVAEALNGGDPPAAVLLLAHFPNILGELETTVDRAGLDRRIVRCALAKAWNGDLGKSLDEARPTLIVVGERHLLRSHDEAIVEAAENASGRCRLVFHLSLDDPLIRRFSGEWVPGMLKSLGMKDDECIESQMVARRLMAVQEKIEQHSFRDRPAESAEKWLRLNEPE